MLAACGELGVGLVPYSPLGRGFLTGQIRRFEDLPEDDYRRIAPRFQGENFQKNLDLVRHIEDLARQKRCTAAQLALAWVLAQGETVVPIPGTKRRKYLEENVGALDVTLSAEDLVQIDEIAPKGGRGGPALPGRDDEACERVAGTVRSAEPANVFAASRSLKADRFRSEGVSHDAA